MKIWRGWSLTISPVLSLAVILLLALSVGVLPADAASAGQNQGGVKLSAQAGYDGYCKGNQWIPVHAILENSGPDLSGQLSASSVQGSNTKSDLYAANLDLPGQSRKEIVLYLFPDNYVSSLDISFTSGNKTIASARVNLTCLTSNDLLFGVMAGSQTAYNVLTDLRPQSGTAAVAKIELKDIPDQGPALGALDVIVISNTDTGGLSESQKKALSAWVAAGGRLIVTGGPDWQKTAAGLAGLMPVSLNGDQNVDSLDALQNLADQGAALRQASAGVNISGTLQAEALDGGAIIATGELAQGASVLARQGDFPLAVKMPHGAGTVYYLAADPALPPLKGWDSAPDLYRALLNQSEEKPGWASGFSNWDMASQAAASMPGLSVITLFLVCGFLGVYVLAIGPLSYFILNRLKRRELAWVTIPVLVVTFTCIAFLSGGLIRGSVPILNRLAIVQVRPGASQAQVNGLVGLYAPNRGTYQLNAGTGALVHTTQTNPTPNKQSFVFNQSGSVTSISGIKLEGGGMEIFGLEGQAPAPAFSYDLRLMLDSSGTRLEGSVTNQSDLTLENAVVLAPGGTQALGSFRPGEKRDIVIYLNKAQMSSGAPGSKGGYTAPASPYYGPAPYYYSGYDTTVSDILGTSSYYDNKEIYRRYALIAAAYGNGYGGYSSRGAGIYLTGWVSKSPLDISLGNKTSLIKNYQTIDTNLYIVTLSADWSASSGELTLPPGLFSWSVMGSSAAVYSYGPSPYNTQLGAGNYSIEFHLIHPIEYRSVKSLTLHIQDTSSASISGLVVSLYDYEAHSWAEIPNLAWGDNLIPDPERYVGPGGSIELQIENKSNYTTFNIQTSDFTLVVER